eukprot:1932913-Rhodomonas_salina.2
MRSPVLNRRMVLLGGMRRDWYRAQPPTVYDAGTNTYPPTRVGHYYRRALLGLNLLLCMTRVQTPTLLRHVRY